MTDVELPVLDTWSARKLRPIVIVYVLAVFVVFAVVSILVFDSPEAAKGLLLAAVGTIVATVPGVLEMIEYRATETGVEKRRASKESAVEFESLFRWEELDHVVPMRHGFKFYKEMGEISGLRRFWKLHIADEYSGEVHAEAQDLGRVLALVERQSKG